ncbi:cytoplasmic protein [Coprinopsis cinerea okayama7|uniref:Cytoplasmic protein n=1 Tax=Coprinopsis cinerea (strain Okayama-7 / 130 / ATCC MYA-4618 / FGSC 9003) TaxID=240176 RepID=A8N6P2_COPC7|nr:cytoplasmic protein [Coprinopsis cinerea okayama7\|eukprot:XP_001830498.1 cytoplasmic protein [Coprinopsis cinerea okayama7\
MASNEEPQQQLFTCLSCSIAFLSAEEQRLHYRSDHHRYNMKRRVAGLPPISATLFNQRVLERKTETAITTTPKSMTCEICNKVYTSENTYKSHLQSKKHRERELQGLVAKPPKPAVTREETPAADAAEATEQPISTPDAPPAPPSAPAPATPAAESDEDIERTIEEKIAAARARLSPLDCLFCPHKSSSLEDSLTHMSLSHSFFIPDADYLIDIQGLITYLGEKIAVGNVCIFCNEKSKGFRSLEAARKHMIDKGHCKLAYDTENDRLELADYYDFSSSYPDSQLIRRKVKTPKAIKESEEWEDVTDDDGEDADEVVDVSDSESEEDELPESQITYGDSEYELVLPSGARIGHRSMRRYYAQSFTPVLRGKNPDDPNSGAALVRRLIADKNSALVPTRGGFGAFGAGTVAVKARNRGEAREAGRHVREFRDVRRREEFKTKVAYINNSQKHFRMPFLQ